VVEGLGGTIHNVWLTYGEYGTVLILAAGQHRGGSRFYSVHIGGALKDVKTTPLLRWEERLEAMRKASDVGYRPPGG
jgi:uncharacterized protein with GYD domain